VCVSIKDDCRNCVIKWSTERKFSLERDVHFVLKTEVQKKRGNNELDDVRQPDDIGEEEDRSVREEIKNH